MNKSLLSRVKETLRFRETLCFTGFFFLILFYFLLFPVPLGDDFWFQIVGRVNLLEFASSRYNSWSSRCIIEILLVFFCTRSYLLLKLLTAAAVTAAAVLIYKLECGDVKRGALFVCTLVVLFISFDSDVLNKYFNIFSGAGFAATSLNYVLPAVAGLAALYPLKKLYDSKSIAWYEWLIYLPCLILAANQEQLSFVLLVFYLLFTVYFLIKKELKPLLLVQLFLSAVSLVFILVCPGNKARLLQETGTWYPRFAHLGLLEKIDIGISATLEYFFTAPPLLMVAALLLAITVFKKYDKTLYRIISSLPLFVMLLFGPLSSLTDYLFKGLPTAFNGAKYMYGWLNLTGSPALASPLKFLIGAFAAAAMLISVYLAFGHNFKSLIMCVTFAVGLMTKMVIGFSPTVYVSGERTAFVFLLSLLIICAALFKEISGLYSEKTQKLLTGGATVLGILAYVTICIPVLGI